MNLDTELETWRREWQSESSVPADLRRRVERQSRWLKIALAADILVTIVIGGGAAVVALRAPGTDMILLAAATWIFIAIAWTFRLVSNRGLWSPSAMDTAAFVELLIKRCRAKIAATVFGAGLYAAELAFCLGWIYHYSTPRPALLAWLFGSLVNDLVWVVTLAFFGFLIWYRRRKRAELAWLLTLDEPTRSAGLQSGPYGQP